MSFEDLTTDTETRLAEEYVSVLDFVSRCAQAMESGNWNYLADKARQLEDAAGRLRQVSSETWKEIAGGAERPRPEVMRAAVAHWGRHYRAGRLLHPEGGES